MKKNEKGFSAIEVFLVIIVVALIGLAGWYVLSRNSDSTSTNTTDTKTTDSQQAQSNVKLTVENSITVMTTDNKVQFYLPKSWEVTDRVDGVSKCGFVEGDAEGDTCFMDVSLKPTSLDARVPFIWYVKIFKSQKMPKDWFNTYVGEGCILSSSQKSSIINNNSSYYAKFDTEHCSGQDFYTISNGSYVAYFVDQGRESGKVSAADTTKFADDFKNIVDSVKFNN